MTLDCTCDRLRAAEEKAAKWDGIVRCGECRWYFEGKKRGCIRFWAKSLPKSLLDYPILPTEPDGFCHRGERREDA